MKYLSLIILLVSQHLFSQVFIHIESQDIIILEQKSGIILQKENQVYRALDDGSPFKVFLPNILLSGFFHYQDSLVIVDKFQKKYTYFLSDINGLTFLEKTMLQRKDKSVIRNLINRNITGEFTSNDNEKLKIDNAGGIVRFYTWKDAWIETGRARISDRCFGWDWIVDGEKYQLAFSVEKGKGVLKSMYSKNKVKIYHLTTN